MYLICDYKGVIAEICQYPAWVRKQTNGVVVLCDEKDADSIYSNDTDSFFPASKSAVSGNSYHLEEVEELPEGVTALDWQYVNGEFSPVEDGTNLEPEVRARKTEQIARSVDSQTTALQLGLVEAYEQSLQAQASAEQQVTDLQIALVELYESLLTPEQLSQ